MDPVQQVLAQRDSGSAEGQGLGQFYAQGRQLNLSRRRLELEQAQEARIQREQDALLPLQQQQLKIGLVNQGAAAVLGLEKARTLMESNAALPEVYQFERRFMQAEDGFLDKGLLQEFADWSQRHPRAVGPGTPGGDLKTQIKAAIIHRNDFIRVLEEDKKLEQRGLYLRSFDAHTGQTDVGLRDTTYKQQRLDNERERLRLEADRLRLSGDAQGLRQVTQRLKALELGYDIEQPGAVPVTPAATSPEVGPPMAPAATTPAAAPAINRIERPPTAAVVTQLQKDNNAADSALTRLDVLERTIKANPDAFGVVGIGKELWESVAGQLNPTSDARVSRAREEAGLTFVELADSLRTDTGNMSLYEQRRLAELGDTRQWRDHPARALAKAETIRGMVVAKKLRTLNKLRATPEDSLLQLIPDKEVAPLLRSGLLSAADAVRWHRLKQNIK